MLFPFKKEYEYFLLLCKTLNISKASETLDLQQPTLSKALKKLETEHKGKLFIRTSTGLKLTETGTQLQRSVLSSLKTFEDKQNDNSNNSVNGHFTLSAHQVIALDFYPKFLNALMKNYPLLHIKADFCSSREATRKVAELESDFAIVADPIASNNLVIKKVVDDTVSIWTNDLKNTDEIIYYNPEMIGISQLLKSYKNYKQVPITDYELIVQVVSNSKALGVLPKLCAMRHKKLKELKGVKKNIPICLVYNSERPKTRSFMAILEKIREIYSN